MVCLYYVADDPARCKPLGSINATLDTPSRTTKREHKVGLDLASSASFQAVFRR